MINSGDSGRTTNAPGVCTAATSTALREAAARGMIYTTYKILGIATSGPPGSRSAYFNVGASNSMCGGQAHEIISAISAISATFTRLVRSHRLVRHRLVRHLLARHRLVRHLLVRHRLVRSHHLCTVNMRERESVRRDRPCYYKYQVCHNNDLPFIDWRARVEDSSL